MKLKPLKPTLREKKRFVVFEANRTFPKNALKRAVEDSFMRLYGETGLGAAGLIFLDEYFTSDKGMVRVSHKNVNHLKASFTLINEISNDTAMVRTLGVSGTIKKALTFIRGNDGG